MSSPATCLGDRLVRQTLRIQDQQREQLAWAGHFLRPRSHQLAVAVEHERTKNCTSRRGSGFRRDRNRIGAACLTPAPRPRVAARRSTVTEHAGRKPISRPCCSSAGPRRRAPPACRSPVCSTSSSACSRQRRAGLRSLSDWNTPCRASTGPRPARPGSRQSSASLVPPLPGGRRRAHRRGPPGAADRARGRSSPGRISPSRCASACARASARATSVNRLAGWPARRAARARAPAARARTTAFPRLQRLLGGSTAVADGALARCHWARVMTDPRLERVKRPTWRAAC